MGKWILSVVVIMMLDVGVRCYGFIERTKSHGGERLKESVRLRGSKTLSDKTLPSVDYQQLGMVRKLGNLMYSLKPAKFMAQKNEIRTKPQPSIEGTNPLQDIWRRTVDPKDLKALSDPFYVPTEEPQKLITLIPTQRLTNDPRQYEYPQSPNPIFGAMPAYQQQPLYLEQLSTTSSQRQPFYLEQLSETSPQQPTFGQLPTSQQPATYTQLPLYYRPPHYIFSPPPQNNRPISPMENPWMSFSYSPSSPSTIDNLENQSWVDSFLSMFNMVAEYVG